ncbi:cell filamentation protein [Helicobacter cetorum MIT 99-5656]|uniref:Cell filamentation protein n=1 Tax=Helicobacter cetorum (strain ATCC BAA-540 / CCUG 52418 / MIT 99-5656) TaxID=1163745 RepID=I0ESV7_HELCM|nr:cell filamentation protein [Helicobacter cetorum MIT 99-5656]
MAKNLIQKGIIDSFEVSTIKGLLDIHNVLYLDVILPKIESMPQITLMK